jgi:hypothetical protein
METRGLLAEFDRGTLRLWGAAKVAFFNRRWLARVVAPRLTTPASDLQLITVCGGALLAADAGLLGSHRCTTHHESLADLARLAPGCSVAGNRLFLVDGAVASSAGITAGIDLALHLIAQDCGAALAASVAAVCGQIQLDWGGALAWIALPPAQADLDVHALVSNAAGRDGHAQRLYMPAGLTSVVPAQPRLDPGLAALSARVKAQFDPANILSPAATPGGSA